MEDLFHGKLVRLAADDPDTASVNSSRRMRNSQYRRLLDSEAPQLWSVKAIKRWIERDLDREEPDRFYFNIHTLEDDRSIGFVGLRDVRWHQRDAWVGIGIGEPDCWGRGYGTDAMRLVLRFAFLELGLERVSLSAVASNRRAIRSYEKAGFKPEGLERKVIQRDGKSEDALYMGILREEWAVLNNQGVDYVGI